MQGWKITATIASILVTGVGLYGEYIHEPLKNRGVFDAIVDRTVYRVFRMKTRELAPSPQLYQPLSLPREIRLLVLEPGSGADEPVRCRLVHVDLLSWRTRYDALSYTWGDPAVRSTILCDGRPTSVTTNLHSALVHLRDPHSPRVIWVDALCINQVDMEERGKQVKKMALIYSRARQVLIWLGEETSDVVHSLSALQELGPTFRTLHLRRMLSNAAPWLEPFIHVFFPFPAIPDPTPWESVCTLLERPWFQRMWVIQEVALARRATIICGHDTLPWRTFEQICLGISSYRRLNGPIVEAPRPDVDHALHVAYMIREIRKDRHSLWLSRRWSKPTSSFMDMLHHTRSQQCGDSRDKIFGILGIASDADPNDAALSPNYSLSVAEVFKRATTWHIMKRKSLMMLSCPSDKEGSEYSLPSWVPDFTRIEYHRSLLRMEKRFEFDAALHGVVEVKISDDGNVLTLRGIAIDRVKRVATLEFPGSLEPSATSKALHPPDGVLDPAVLAKARNWLAECVRIASEGDAGTETRPGTAVGYWQEQTFGLSKDRWNKFWRTMIWGLNPHGQQASALYGTNVREYAKFVNQTGLEGNPAWRVGVTVSVSLAEQCMGSYTVDRRFCVTERGTLGWVPRGARPGDFICVLNGGSVPFVLRRCAAGYKLVGDAYIEGWMKGTFWQLVQLPERDFPLV
ncbi:hypothetical protein MFIFM68171_06713 [Madurella fahalii]|uniref:Heterokaryon incompatibility domain-containing protein n=1 Tax=Madurella fahalii TaxID=1157608 RepID=A0ABQ0GFG4_9PEZI